MKEVNKFVVLDTNKWYEQKLLRTAAGAALIFAVTNTQRKIGIPDIIRREIISKCAEKGKEKVDKIRGLLNLLQQLTGERFELDLPIEEELRDKAQERLSDLQDLLYQKEITLSHYQNALSRTIEKEPPASDGKEFKDCLIWEALLEIANDSGVEFICGDKGFMDEDGALKQELQNEANECQYDITFYKGLKGFLNDIDQEVSRPDDKVVLPKIKEGISSEISDYSEKHDFRIGKLKEASINFSLTDDPNSLAALFEFIYKIIEVRISEHKKVPEAEMVVAGSCIYKIENNEVSEIDFDEITHRTLAGGKIARTVYAGPGQATYGAKTREDFEKYF